MTDYTITTNFGAKDDLPSGNAAKVIKGEEFTTEFTNIQTAVNTKADTAGDTFTGVVNFSDDVAVNTNTLFVDVSEAKVGIGTSSPDTSLHVDGGDVKISSDSATSNGDGKPTIFFSESNADEVYAQISYHGDDESGTNNFIGIGCSGAFGTTEALLKENHQMVVKASGNVGIGTTTITNPVNYSKVLNIAGSAPALVLSEDSGRDYTIGVNGNKLFIFDETDAVMTIDDSGNVGIGTSSPANTLTVGALEASTNDQDATVGIKCNANHRGIILQENDGAEQWEIGVGEAGALKFYDSGSATPAVTFQDGTGNVGIGTSSPQSKFVVQDTNGCVSKIVATDGGGAPSATAQLIMQGYEGRGAGIFIQDSKLSASNPNDRAWFMGTGYSTANFGIGYAADGVNTHYLAQNMLTIDTSGSLLVGTTSDAAFNGGFAVKKGAVDYINVGHSSSVSHGNYYVAFRHGANTIGTITQSGTTGISYNTTSDERLKENITDSADAGSKIDAIQIRQFDWKADGSHQNYGVIAQELATVAPEAVHQPVDEEDMMGVDYSKLVPMLIKEVQSLRSRVAELESE
jgi:hypothetical protein